MNCSFGPVLNKALSIAGSRVDRLARSARNTVRFTGACDPRQRFGPPKSDCIVIPRIEAFRPKKHPRRSSSDKCEAFRLRSSSIRPSARLGAVPRVEIDAASSQVVPSGFRRRRPLVSLMPAVLAILRTVSATTPVCSATRVAFGSTLKAVKIALVRVLRAAAFFATNAASACSRFMASLAVVSAFAPVGR
jgi:hypothetical protein